jgi:Cytidylate kinase-like family
MAVWTIAAEAGTGGAGVAAGLAAAADTALLDRDSLALFARELNPEIGDARGLEERVGGRLNLSALSIAMSTGSEEAFRELRMLRALPEIGRTIMARAAQAPCVILAAAGFAALPDHPSAIHVRLRAPLEWRIAAYQRDNVVDRRCAEKAVKHDDHVKRVWVRTLYGVDVDDARQFSLVLDASRLSAGRIVETMLAAAGIGALATVHAGFS